MVSVIGLVVLVLVVYYVFMSGRVLQMLNSDTYSILLVFALLALIPSPPFFIMGIVLMNIWHRHRFIG